MESGYRRLDLVQVWGLGKRSVHGSQANVSGEE
jgi:hypothetical protein